MLGSQKLRLWVQPIAVSLEALVPTKQFYRHLDATLVPGFVRDRAADRYAERRWPSIDPSSSFISSS